jgi:hypothetical protein
MSLIKELRLLGGCLLPIDDAAIVRYLGLVPDVGAEPEHDAAKAGITRLLGRAQP